MTGYGIRNMASWAERKTASGVPLVGIADESVDAFGRLRVSDPYTLFAGSFTYDTQPLLFEKTETTSGTVTHDTDSRSTILTVTGTSGSTAATQTRQWLPYEPGKSALVKATFALGGPAAGVRRRVGYFDQANGFFLEQTGDGLFMVRRSSSSGELVETRVAQVDWNIDKLDGFGASGQVIDVSRAQIWVCDGQWLGVGRVRVGFNIDGATVYVHEFLHANREPVSPYTQTFSLPVRWEIESTAASAGATMQAICCEVESEGGVSSPNGLAFSAANVTDVATSTTRGAVLSIRPATQYPADSGLVNRSFIIPGEVSTIVASQACLAEVMYGSTLSGGTWTRANTNSAVEYGLGQTIDTPGIVVESFFVSSGGGVVRGSGSQGIDSQYPLTLDIAGANPKALTIAVTALTGTGTARAAINWKEIR